MGKFGDFMKNYALPAIGTAIPFLGQLLSARSQRREYDKMLAYNSPKAQMQRYSEAGLSPYLIYDQGSSGNVSSPRPPEVYPTESGIDRYMSMANFDVNQRIMETDYTHRQMMLRTQYLENQIKESEMDKKRLELMTDYPDYIDRAASEVAGTGYRRKLLELKKSVSEATVDKILQSVEGQKYKNVVESVKARYAEDFGMVGGDWTQGLGLIKSIPSMFRGARKVPSRGTLPPWQSTIRTNPILNQRLRRRASKGVVNP